jgi:putative PIG3 family NAD(P)H quinone oxidoreductase|tara:strand:+ start:1327 stop:2298 length:972 start_codon:yes stop_codon:yes gene_type:complete
MKAILFDKYGDSSVLYIGEAPKPIIGDNEVLIKVTAAGVNRPDILQRQGGYPPPKGASEILGLEVSGKIVEIGKNIDLDFKGKEVCALVTGGGYAEYVKTTLATVLPVPKGLNVVDAAAIPETFFTVWTNLFNSGSLKKNETLLIHGGASGIGITAALIAKAMGIKFCTTVGSVKKKKFMEQLGSTLTINYQNEDFEEVIKKELKGVDVILDIVGGEYFQKNINILNKFGRLINIAYLQGPIVKANLLPIMLKRLIVTGSTLRIRSDEEKQNIRDSIKTHIWPLFENETINMIIDKEFGFYDVKKAHEYMENNKNIGKLLLKF